jgi:cyclopropane-fatty-acyl-phospholipid synthase
MNAPERILPLTEDLPTGLPARARLLFGLFKHIQFGSIALTTPTGEEHVFTGRSNGPRADLQIKEWKAVSKMLSAADIGIAECWRDGLIDSKNMTTFLEFCIANERAIEQVFYGNAVMGTLYRLLHWLRPNTRKGSEKNIHAHYDLGNSFYKLWLDPSMTYSAGIFKDERTSLEESQFEKYDRICRELELKPGMRVLEVGCGWGGFAEHAATHYGAKVDGITISREQLAWGKERIAMAGLDDLVTLRYCDYRDLTGEYERIVSIEMIEAVGERFWPTYFKTLHDRLQPGGRAMIQGITIAHEKFERYRTSSDFIREYIFPGGMLASPERFIQEAQRAGLKAAEPYFFGLDYARTLREWDARVSKQREPIAKLGFDDKFMKIWRFYLHYCEAGFNSGRTNVMQIEFSKAA